jgi:hypothetical protein
MSDSTSGRSFLQAVGVGATVAGLKGPASAQQKTIQGFEDRLVFAVRVGAAIKPAAPHE